MSSDYTYNVFAENLKKLREKRGLSQNFTGGGVTASEGLD